MSIGYLQLKIEISAGNFPMPRRLRNFPSGCLHRSARNHWLLLVVVGVLLPGPTLAEDRFQKSIAPLLRQHCVKCHGQKGEPMGEIDLTKYRTTSDVVIAQPVWAKVAKALQSHAMPPESEPQLALADRDQLVEWADEILAKPAPNGRRDPGHVVPRRLNRVEYNFTVQDLFGIPRGFQRNYNPQSGFPKTPIRMTRKTTLPIYLPVDGSDHGFDNIGEVLTLPPHLMEKYLATATQLVEIASGSAPKIASTSSRARGFVGQETWVFRDIPKNADPRTEAATRLRDFLTKAFRRPVSDEELRPYLGLFDQAYKEEGSFPAALKLPVRAALVSPHFLFRIEGLADASSKPGQVIPVTDYELATRLSYFLWSTMPDEQLLRFAQRGDLQKPEELAKQVRRMLRDPKILAFSDTFLTQWLQIETVESAKPDPELFPIFRGQPGHMLLNYMLDESKLLFEYILLEDKSILDLVGAEYAFLNRPLAEHYRIFEPRFHGPKAGREFVRYELDDPRRGGVLTFAAVHTATSQSTRTSPVARGKWVLEVLLGSPPPPPPPNVAELEEAGGAAENLPLRKKLELHRQNPDCAACHNRMDPLGLALENFDPIGQWREQESGLVIDAAVKLPDGTSLNGPVDLKEYLLKARRDDFVRCLVEHMLTFALGRPLEYYDAAAVNEIKQKLEADDYRFSTLVLGIVDSYPFQHRRTEEPSP